MSRDNYVDLGVVFCGSCGTQLGHVRDDDRDIPHNPTDCIAKLADKLRWLQEVDDINRRMLWGEG